MPHLGQQVRRHKSKDHRSKRDHRKDKSVKELTRQMARVLGPVPHNARYTYPYAGLYTHRGYHPTQMYWNDNTASYQPVSEQLRSRSGTGDGVQAWLNNTNDIRDRKQDGVAEEIRKLNEKLEDERKKREEEEKKRHLEAVANSAYEKGRQDKKKHSSEAKKREREEKARQQQAAIDAAFEKGRQAGSGNGCASNHTGAASPKSGGHQTRGCLHTDAEAARRHGCSAPQEEHMGQFLEIFLEQQKQLEEQHEKANKERQEEAERRQLAEMLHQEGLEQQRLEREQREESERRRREREREQELEAERERRKDLEFELEVRTKQERKEEFERNHRAKKERQARRSRAQPEPVTLPIRTSRSYASAPSPTRPYVTTPGHTALYADDIPWCYGQPPVENCSAGEYSPRGTRHVSFGHEHVRPTSTRASRRA